MEWNGSDGGKNMRYDNNEIELYHLGLMDKASLEFAGNIFDDMTEND
jgi:hypothetical protein